MPAGWIAAGSALLGAYSASQQTDAANNAAGAQTAASQAGIAQQKSQFDAIQKLLAPYVSGGTNAFGQQQNLIGVNGAGPQASAISALQSSPGYTSALQAGNNNILANASATGGLRGGNVQGALGQFAPSLLAATINDRFNQLGTISQQGLGAATQTGSFGQASANNVTGLLGNIGSAQAGAALGVANGNIGYANAIGNGVGMYAGLKSAGVGQGGNGFSYDYGNNYNPNDSNGGFGYKNGTGGF